MSWRTGRWRRPSGTWAWQSAVAVTLKSSKWSDGRPVTANDLLFDIDLIKAGIKEAPSNWSGYVPGHFPDNLVSTSEPSASTLVMNFSGPVNLTWFTNNYLGQGPLIPLPPQVWAKTSATGPIVTDWNTDPAVATKIFNFLTVQARPIRCRRPSTGRTRSRRSAPPPAGTRWCRTPPTAARTPNPMPTFRAVPFTSDTAEFNAIKADSIDLGYVPPTDVPQLPQLSRPGLQERPPRCFGCELRG
jgi:peptide/nickel transport system substrate-binding protein